MTTTRREALLALLTLGTIGTLPAMGLIVSPMLDEPDEPQTTYPEWAGLLARLELSAIKSSRPYWRKLNYSGVIRWSNDPSILAAYGVGRPDQTDDDCCSLLAWFAEQYGMEGPTPIVGCYRTPCKRSYCFLFEAEADLFEAIDEDEPTWKRVYADRLREFEQGKGRTVPRAFVT